MILPASVDVRSAFEARGLAPGSQGARGTCSLFALVGVLEFESASPVAASGVRLSVEFINWASHQTSGRTVDGSFFRDALVGLRRFGICRETLMPYAPSFDANPQPSATALEDALTRRAFSERWIKPWNAWDGMTVAQISAIKHSLASGHPVAVGLRWPKKPEYGRDSLLVQPPPADVFDGHSILIAGYADDAGADGGGTFLFRNHAGSDWQEHGYARFSYAYAMAYANDAVAIVV